jgi:thymidylate synthase
MNNLDKQYQSLLQDILENGVKKETRNGDTISVFGRQIRHNMKDGFPVLTTKKMAFKTMVTELLWFLRGDTNIKFLVDNGCNIWNGDCFSHYLKKYEQDKTPGIVNYSDPLQYRPYTQEEFINVIKTDDKFANKWGELGPVYGKQWRNWDNGIVNSLGDVFEREVKYDIENSRQPYSSSMRKYVTDEIKKLNPPIDQIQNLINDLKTNPDSRRLMVNAWNVGELDQMVLPPCHYGFQVYTRELSVVERMGYYGKHFMKENESKSYDELLKVNYDELNIPTRAISLMYNCRSQDVPLGTPFNLASYGLLLTILAKEVNMVPDELISNMGDCHIYLNQIDGVKERLTREPFELPTLNQFPTYEGTRPSIESYVIGDFTLKNYQSHPTIKMPLSN